MKMTVDKIKIKVLYLEDSPRDIEIIRELLIDANYDLDIDYTEKKKEFTSLLQQNTYDIILSDFKLPNFDAFEALKIAKEICPDVPFICVSGSIGEEVAIDLIKMGAVDYVLKDRLVRLPASIKRALDEVKEKNTRQKIEIALHESEQNYKALIDGMNETVWIIDFNGNIVDVNTTALKVLGYSKEEILKKGLYGVDTSLMKEDIQALAKAMLSDKTQIFETTHRTKSGRIFPVEVCSSLVSYHGKKAILSIARDITDRKITENKLQALSLRQEAVLSAVPDIIMEVDNKKIYTWANRSGIDFFGDDVIGKEASFYFEGDQNIYQTVDPIFKGNENIIYVESWQRRKDGQKRLLAWWCRVLKDSRGNVIGALSSARDLTEQKRAEKTLREDDQFFRQLFTTSPDSILLFDPFSTAIPWEIIDCNEVACRMNGYTREELIGKSVDLINTLTLTPEERETHMKMLQNRGVVYFETLHRRKDGQIFPIEVASSIVTLGGRQLILGIDRDITERKQVEIALRDSVERYQNLTKISPIGIFHTDEKGSTTYINPKYCQISGLKFEDALGDGWMQAVHPDDKKRIIDSWQMATRFHKASFTDYRFIHPDGTIRWVMGQAIPELNSENQIVGYIGTITDITEHVKVEKEIEKKEARLKDLFETAPVGYHEIDALGNITAVNQTELKMLGYTFEEMIGWPIWEFTSDVEESRKRILDKLADKIPADKNYVQSYTRKDETSFPAIVDDVILRKEDGRITGIRTTILDITDRKKSEEELRQTHDYLENLLSFANAPIIVWDHDNKITRFNLSFEKLTGYSIYDVLDKHIEILFPVETRNELTNLLSRIMEGENLLNIELPVVCKNGYTRIVSWNTANIYSADGKAIIATIAHGLDITDHKKTEEALIYEQNLLKSLMDNTSDHIYFKDKNSRFIRISKSQAELFGLSDPKLAIGKTDFDFFSQEHAQQAFNNEQEIIKSSLPMENFEEKETWNDGSITWVSTTKVPLKNITGEVIGTFGISRDITRRKLVEEELREKEVQYRNLADSGTALIWRSGLDKLCDYFNEPWLKFTGRTLEQELGNGWAEGVHPDDFDRCLKTYVTAFDKHEAFEMEYRLRHNTGEYRWIQDLGNPNYDNNGKFIGYIGHCFDITERRQIEEALQESELRYRRLVEFSPDAIAVQCDGLFVYVNPAAVKLFGAKEASQLEGTPFLDIVNLESKELVRQRILSGLKNGKPLTNIEEKFQKLDGSIIDVEIASLPIVYKGKSAIQLIIRDISEKKKMQNHLLQTQKVQSIGTLAGGIAHDFNNILGIVLAYSSVLEHHIDDPKKVVESVTAINSAVNRGAALVRQILTFARQTDVMIRPMSVPELAHEIVIMLQETFPKVIEFREIFDRGIPLINADHTQMHQAILNLCVNARDAMPKGGTITIRIQTVALENVAQKFENATFDNYVCLSVSDTGIGMAEDTKNRIFDPFFTTKELGKGTGLGLSVVYGIMQTHYGFINVESEVGQGTTFYLYLPIPQEYKIISTETEIKQTKVVGGTELILIVEDEELLREVVQSTLQANGYDVLVAADGQEAIDVYQKHYQNIALVLTDMGLPKISGIDEYAQLKKINPKVKVIFASGFITLDARSELLKDGVKGFIQKPYNVAEVLRLVREILDEK